MDLTNEGSPTKKQRMVPAKTEAEVEAANYVQYFPEINFVDELDKSDPVSGLFPNEIIELLVTYMPYCTQCICQVASRSLQSLIKAVQRSHSKWPEFMAAVQKKAPREYDDVFTKLSKFDEKARVVDRSNNYYWYQKCPICMKSKEMDIINETETAMKMKCSLCEQRYGCAIVWTYSFDTIACADCGGKRPKGFTCFNCKKTYCQECKFYDRALNAYGCAENVCTRCVRQCGHACDWGYVVGTAETCSDCNKKLCGRCAHYGSDCLDGSGDDSDEENDEVEEEEDGEEEEDIEDDEEDEDNESEDEKDQPKDESEHDDKEYVSLTAEEAAKLAQVEENLKKWRKYF